MASRSFQGGLAAHVPPRLLDIHGAISATTLSRSKIYELIAAGAFPRPFALAGLRRVVWDAAEVEAWISDEIARAKSAA